MAIEKREQVFISSTFRDLVDERREVIQTLLEADCIPSGMELFPASDDEKFDLIKRVIDLCDYYIVILGGRYGSVDYTAQISYTEMEFDYAVAQKKPIMGFLHGTPGKIEANKTDLDPALRDKLDAFREKVGQKIVKYWHSPAELGAQVAKSLIQIRKSHPAEGWVRASDAMTPETRQELAELQARVAQLTAELQRQQERRREDVDTSDLAQGDDNVSLELVVEFHTSEQIAQGKASMYNRKKGRGTYSTTWNAVFKRLAPEMMDEASESRLTEVLSGYGVELVRVQASNTTLGAVYGADVVLESFNDVKVQLSALGLIERSERRRAISDKNTYWRLTSRGVEQLMRLRAIRRPQPGGDDLVTVER